MAAEPKHRPVIWSIDGGVCLRVRVQPAAKRQSISWMEHGIPKLAIRAPAVDGKANQALCQWIAEMMGVATSHVTVVAGLTSREKTVRIDGATEALVHDALTQDLPST